MKENLDISIEDYFQKVEELKNDGYEMMVDLTAIDWFRKKEPRFEVVVNFLSVSKNKRISRYNFITKNRINIICCSDSNSFKRGKVR